MIGYKAFDKDLKCRGMQFEVGKTYKTNANKKELQLCSNTVIHFCRELHCIETESNYVLLRSRVCEIIATGDIIEDGSKFGTNKIKILRELTKKEIEKFCNRNTGICNTGNGNAGNRNTGNCNAGICNTGNGNAGICNTGNGNAGNRNTGNGNAGNRNTGNGNAGDCNAGDCNAGNWNAGDCNAGDCNAGDCNAGNCNAGDCNAGNCNAGDWNSGNRNTGFFNTITPTITMFNKPTEVNIEDIAFPDFLYFDLIKLVYKEEATDEEKEIYEKEIKTFGCFFKKLEYKEAFRVAWDKASPEEHKKLLKLPNWDNEIFKEISGIDAEAEIAKEEG